jgi:membrane peptidoglycan carboxypeptidase
VARRALKKPNEKPAPKIAKKDFFIFKKVLIFVGKPAFFILSHILIGFLFVFYITGHIFRLFTETFAKLLRQSLIDFSKIFRRNYKKIYKLKLPKIPKLVLKISLPRIKRPKIILPHIKLHLPQFHFRYLVIVLLVLLFLVIPVSFILQVFKDLPAPEDLTNRNIEVSTKIYDRNGLLLYKIFEDENRTLITLDKIPLHVKLATLAAEDAEFYNHPGFSLKGITRAIYKNLTKGELTGGSTITQQLVKNALLNPEKTFLRKAKEITLALQVEMSFTKDQILEMYLNEVSYGGTAYGIQEAAWQYFNKDVDKLSLGEAALLAGLPKSPTKYSPFGGNPSLSLGRQKEILHLMKINGYITETHEKEAGSEILSFADQKTDIKAPHFVMYVRQILEENYGKEVVGKGGLNVITTLDYEVQKLAESIVANEIEKLKPLNVTNAASIVLNPTTGEILAMVGSHNYFDKQGGNVNVTTSERQPGSSIKIVNYAYALSHGSTPASIISDTPVTFLVEGQPPYTPKNYDSKYSGNLTLRNAFAQSRNIPAVRVLASYGVKNMIEMGKKMGITTWEDENRFGLSLTLGGGEIKLIDLAQVYATVANYGKKPDISPIINITDYQGKNIYLNSCIGFGQEQNEKNLARQVLASEITQKNCKQEEILDPRVAFLLTDILKDNTARTPAFGSFSQLVIPNHKEVAVKTGTSNNLRDNLTIGYNQKYLVAVWVGNNDNSPMARVASGVTGASPIFNKIMTSLLANEANHEWDVPDGLVQSKICLNDGQTKIEWFLAENKPKADCISKEPQRLGNEDTSKDKEQ